MPQDPRSLLQELIRRDPHINDMGDTTCFFCRGRITSAMDLATERHHKADCIWQRARLLLHDSNVIYISDHTPACFQKWTTTMSWKCICDGPHE